MVSMEEVEALWAQDQRIPLELAPIALWHLFETPQPVEDRVMLNSEEHLGEGF